MDNLAKNTAQSTLDHFMDPTPHPTCEQYGQWFTEATGLDSFVQEQIQWPSEVVCFFDGETHEELLRVFSKNTLNREGFAQKIPPHLSTNSPTLSLRKDLLKLLLNNPGLLEKASASIRAIEEMQRRIARAPESREFLRKAKEIDALAQEVRRQKQLLIFSLDDLSILQMHRMGQRDEKD